MIKKGDILSDVIECDAEAQRPLEIYLHEVSKDALEVDLAVPDGDVAVEDQIVVADVRADDPVREGIDKRFGTARKKARMGDVKR
ncbi:MAG: hypothetical protein ABIJ25_00695 [Pseudomonadota bacterium]